jgi:hypothetical protein
MSSARRAVGTVFCMHFRIHLQILMLQSIHWQTLITIEVIYLRRHVDRSDFIHKWTFGIGISSDGLRRRPHTLSCLFSGTENLVWIADIQCVCNFVYEYIRFKIFFILNDYLNIIYLQ